MGSRTGGGRRGPSVWWLLLVVNGLVLLLPVAALLSLQLYQNHLVRQTETNLIGQAVVIGEAYRARLLAEQGHPPGAEVPAFRPPQSADESFAPIRALVALGDGLLPPAPEPTSYLDARDGPEWRAGQALQPLLERSKVFNLSSARVLDPRGCVVASSGNWLGACLAGHPEIDAALDGRYGAVARERVSDEPKPPLASISRRGDVRVFAALPIFTDGEVIGVVWMSRTSMAPLKAAWLYRRPLAAGLAAVVLVTLLVSLFVSRAITRPLRRITASAEAVARGERQRKLAPQGFAPAEVHALGAALATMTDQLSDRAEYIAEFAANVSHELKSPITAIRGAAELLAEGWEAMPGEQRQRFVANIEADASRMERLVTRLLQLARIQSAPEAAEQLNLRSFLEQVVEGYDGSVVLEVADAPEHITINADHLESAVRNLLDNAVRHGGGQPVELNASAADDRVALAVRDRGPGISAANRERIFDRFFTTERDAGGTGLGLAIVAAVARTRGGDVRVATGADGTTFTLTV